MVIIRGAQLSPGEQNPVSPRPSTVLVLGQGGAIVVLMDTDSKQAPQGSNEASSNCLELRLFSPQLTLSEG